MSSNRGLFDRLREPDKPEERSVHQRTEDIADSVLNHLRRMLNVRHGDAPATPDYGIPALEAQHISASEEMRRAIEESIRIYEPRLNSVRVRYLTPDENEPLKVRYEIAARLATAEESVRVQFHSEVDATGVWRVRA
jgi:type VI secretion system lysozyme-like protein